MALLERRSPLHELERRLPFRRLETMEQQLRRLFPELTSAPMLPAIDVYDAPGEVVIEVDVPGYDRDDLDIEVGDHTLTVSGERRSETEKTERKLHVHERLDSTFARSFALPDDVDCTHVEASFGKGVLTLHIPRTEDAARTKIPIAPA